MIIPFPSDIRRHHRSVTNLENGSQKISTAGSSGVHSRFVTGGASNGSIDNKESGHSSSGHLVFRGFHISGVEITAFGFEEDFAEVFWPVSESARRVEVIA
jgi:hypothetical protein